MVYSAVFKFMHFCAVDGMNVHSILFLISFYKTKIHRLCSNNKSVVLKLLIADFLRFLKQVFVPALYVFLTKPSNSCFSFVQGWQTVF